MSEPIAVAFVEVRPETDDFRTDTERQLSGIGEDFTVRGQVELSGLDQARRDVTGITDSLSRLPEPQLQVGGLEQARQEAVGLGAALKETESITVRPMFEPLLQDVQRLRGEAEQLSARLAGMPTDIPLATDELGAAVDDTAALDEAQASLQSTLSTSADAAGALIARYPQLARGEAQVAAATAASDAATRQAILDEERLVRVRSRRATGLGPFRLAGVGLLAGTAIFGATQALGDLAGALEVTGNEATTGFGKLRNAASAVLGGDLVGAFKALTNETYTYSAAQLRLINQTPELEEALRSMGRGADLARSRLGELTKLAENPVPQFIQTQIAVARASGDPTALRAGLEAAAASVDEALRRAVALGPNQKALAREIAARRAELAEVRDQIARLASDDSDSGGIRILPFGRAGATSPLAQLEAREKRLEGELRGFVQRRNENLPAFNAVREALANAKREQKAAIDQAIADQADDILAPLAEAVTDARLTGSASRIKAALQRQAARLREIIAGFQGSAEDRKRFKDDLLAVNRTIESTQAEINAEAERHRQAMIDDRLAPSEEAIIDAQLSGASTIPALQARAADIQAILRAGTINGKRLSRDERVALKNELVSVNGQIESAQDEIAAEEQRHADAMKAKLQDADQAFLASLNSRETQLRNAQRLEQARAGLQGDIRVSNELQRFYAESIRVARKTINDKRERDQTVAQLQADLAAEAQNERGLRQQQRAEARDRQAEKLDLSIEIAQSNDNTRAEVRARRAKIAFLREQIDTTRRGSVERKRLRAAIAAERASIRELLKEKDKNAQDESGSATSLADLFTRTAEIARVAGADVQLPRKIGDVTQPLENEVTRRLQLDSQVNVKSPFERGADKVVTSQDALRESIDRLAATIPNLTGSTLGGPAAPAPGVVEGMRYNAAARFWNSRRGRQLAQETASA